MSAHLAIGDVSDTAFWVAHYRAKESARADALFQDPFAARLAGERGKAIANSMGPISAYTEWAVVSRTVIIDRFIDQLVRDGVDAVVNLGAGLDARPYRMNLPETLEWVEVDHPNILAYKKAILEADRPKCRLTLFEVDLSDGPSLRSFLDECVPHAKNVLVLTEGVIPYLSPDQVAELGKELGMRPRFSNWITEYFHPNVYRYLKGTVRQLKMKRAPFRFYPADWFGFFGELGWTEMETRFTGEVAAETGRRLPMPCWAEVLLRFAPKKVKKASLRMVGYVILQRERGSLCS